LSWPERIEKHRREIGIPYLGNENGWTYGTWFMGNSYQKQNDYYGGYQGNFLKRTASLFPDRQRVLHLFAGKVDLGKFPGDTLDCRPELTPTYCANAETCEGVPLHLYDFVLADPPYSASDAARYRVCGDGEQEQGRADIVGWPPAWCLRCVARSGLPDVHEDSAEA
jgi:hypothetical protein